MSGVSRKTEISPVDGTPLKRMFWSIISDYDLKTALCELVDNAIDIWMRTGRKEDPNIELSLSPERQIIVVTDKAGGVRENDLRYLVAPGGSKNDPSAELIGIFGVGSKRAGIALGEQVEIKTRFANERSFELDITKSWLESDDWEIAAYEIPDISPSTTQIEISHLRRQFSNHDVGEIRAHLGATYSHFLDSGCTIWLNETPIGPENFDNWAFPPGFAPRSANFELNCGKDGVVRIEITVGLIRDRDPQEENYGAYFYCNDRLIVKALRTRDVGYYVTSEVGVPHPDASLCRGIVRLDGPAQLMPWNSTKNGINTAHAVFEALRPTLIELMKHFSSLSRRLQGDWDDRVFAFDKGRVEPIDPVVKGERAHLVLPPLPRTRTATLADLKTTNAEKLKEMPWTLGLVESIGVLDVIKRQKLETKNRIALILLDSNFEIALKEFIVHRTDLFERKIYTDAKIRELFGRRDLVIKEVSTRVKIPAKLIEIADHYYMQRNKLIHERATISVADSDIETYKTAIEKILAILFNLDFSI